MKRLMALVLVAVMMAGLGTCLGAEWPEGRSAAQPYSNLREVDLTQSMGYIILFPRANMPGDRFCDALRIYLPREDLQRGSGKAYLYEVVDGKKTKAETFDFTDANDVAFTKLTDSQLEDLMWGSGMCVELRLKTSLAFNHSYYVLMDEGCFTAANGAVKSPAITNPEAWTPSLSGDYGVGGLCYKKLPTSSDQDAAGEIVAVPAAGDVITFDLLMNSDTAYAVIYSENGSVEFDQIQYTKSGPVSGRVIKDDVDWSVLFLTADTQIYDSIDLK